MECLKQVNPDEWENIPPLAELYQDLPTTLRCSPHKNNTDFRRKSPKQIAQNAYIGYNTPKVTTFIVIDLDYDGSIFAYHDTGIPRPQFVLKNPKNGHCQYLYRLKDPVTFFKSSRNTPIRLLNAVTDALNDVLGGDKAFTGYLAKNALNSAHEVYYTGAEPYTLGEIASYLDLPDLNSSQAEQAHNDEFYGRNDAIFNTVRKIAISIAYTGTYTQIYAQCLEWCEEYNTRYSPQLPYNELKSISKSIAGYYTSDKFRREFSELQAVRGARGGKVSKRKPAPTSEASTEPWKAMGISRATYYNRKKQGKI
ncbi:replication initiation protein [Psychrobacter sp. H7-1]|uniref:replication initiation protein n=1 Tax=Psychrobacter sp. H7-1 TaxID=1569265 RepID=UPI001918F139|nr:replication initiation protein [Psychrobacter sp. H7-1]